ncbi:hypothetical protein KIH32_01350 [Pseudomonas fluorescens]|uniref:hypothetical protein n=1 Tax=Pseudomonas fluorescens TaxID=294 RepID=UPI001BD95530|nr:hypothetical protein [Pseudomonas fluorescens]MBT0622536.1 hypothetical protein [Pseudomonas fluorescens]
MDIIATLRKKILTLDDGEHIAGLRAALLHIETAFRHLRRGQRENDKSAFTDTVYRTNQAFEGAIKEAYRVHLRKDPSKTTPYDIETYFSRSGTFRERVLLQFKSYRTEWRNPSAHDYRLDFNESEAFLAIVSVTALSCLLVDEINQRVAFDKEKAAVKEIAEKVNSTLNLQSNGLLSQITETLKLYFVSRSNDAFSNEAQWLGSICGFLSEVIPNIEIQTEDMLDSRKHNVKFDILATIEAEQVGILIKNKINVLTYNTLLDQVENMMLAANIKDSVIFFLPTLSTYQQVFESEGVILNGQGRLKTIAPIPIRHRLPYDAGENDLGSIQDTFVDKD